MSFGFTPASTNKQQLLAIALVLAALTEPTWGLRLTAAWAMIRRDFARPDLTPLGNSVKRVVFVKMSSGFCESKQDDWRGDLPRHFVRYLPNARVRLKHPRTKRYHPRQLSRSAVAVAPLAGPALLRSSQVFVAIATA